MKLVEYRPGAKARAVALAVFFCALATRLALAALGLFGGYTVSGTVTVELINYALLFSAFFLVRKKRLLLFSLLTLCLAVNTALFLLHNDGTEYRFPSPARTNSIVIREKSALISSGWAEVYSREYGVLLKKLGIRLGTGDDYHPFPSGQYHIEWQSETSATLTYYDGTAYREIVLTV